MLVEDVAGRCHKLMRYEAGRWKEVLQNEEPTETGAQFSS